MTTILQASGNDVNQYKDGRHAAEVTTVMAPVFLPLVVSPSRRHFVHRSKAFQMIQQLPHLPPQPYLSSAATPPPPPFAEWQINLSHSPLFAICV